MFSDLDLTDMETCYKVFRTGIIKKIQLEENRFGFEPEITAKIGELVHTEGLRLYEVGISYYGRTYEEGKKIIWKDALKALWCIFKYNTSSFAHLVKYGINGLIIASSQLVVITLMIEYLNLKTIMSENIANILSIIISLLIAFFLHSYITWRYKFRDSFDFLYKLLKFYLVSGVSFAIRIVIFYLLSIAGINYKLNAIIGIVIIITINFLGYDRIVYSSIGLKRK
jgi:putative flippase GtrA